MHFRESDADALAAPIRRLRPQIELPGAEVDVGGYAVGFLDVNRAARDDLVRAEAIAFPLLALLLLLIFRGWAPASVPLAIGAIAVLGTLAGLKLLSNVLDISVFALNLAVLLGLGLATDYGLLLVYRYREEAAARAPGRRRCAPRWPRRAGPSRSAARAIAAAFASLLLFPQGFLFSMGIGGIFVALVSAVTRADGRARRC